MAIEAIAALAAKEASLAAAKEASLESARAIAQKMTTDVAGRGGNELQTAMMERQSMQEGFRIGEMPEDKGEGREVLKQREADAAEELRGKLDEGGTTPEIEQPTQTWSDCRIQEGSGEKPVYKLECGKDSELLNGDLPEKSVLELDNPTGKNHISIETNGHGRNIDMRVDRLERIPGGRDVYQQRRCCQIKDGKPGDDGGHLIASEFGGLTEQINYSPMNSFVNRHGEWRRMERVVEKALDAGKTVTDYRVKQSFVGDSLRPEKITVSMKVDGVPQYFQIKNPVMAA